MLVRDQAKILVGSSSFRVADNQIGPVRAVPARGRLAIWASKLERSLSTTFRGGEGRNRAPNRVLPPQKCPISRANQVYPPLPTYYPELPGWCPFWCPLRSTPGWSDVRKNTFGCPVNGRTWDEFPPHEPTQISSLTSRGELIAELLR